MSRGGLRPRLSYANVVATICLFILLGGGAYAAQRLKLPKNSVGTKQIKRNAINGSKVKNHSLTGSDIKASTLGKVPSASTADKLGNSGPGDFLAASKLTTGSQVIDATEAGATATLFQRGPLTVTVKCTQHTGTQVEVDVIASSSQQAIMGFDASEGSLPPNTPVLLNADNLTGPFLRSVNYSFLAQDGTAFAGVYAFGVHVPRGNTAANCGGTMFGAG